MGKKERKKIKIRFIYFWVLTYINREKMNDLIQFIYLTNIMNGTKARSETSISLKEVL